MSSSIRGGRTSEPKSLTAPRYRELKGLWRGAAVFLCLSGISLSAVQIFFILARFGISFYEISYYYALFATFLPPVFLFFPPSKICRRDIVPWYDVLFFVLSLGILVYFSIHGFEVFFEGWMFVAPMMPTVLGTILLLLVLEAVRRTAGIVFLTFCLFFLLFPMFAPYIPSPFTGLGFSFLKTMRIHSMGTESLMGIPIRVLGDLLIGFMIFGVAMTVTGGGRFFLNLSLSLLGHMRGGPAKVAVIASGLFGSLSGSVISNVLTTGSVTIPSMKRSGYEAHYAGAIETCASTGGVLMPPIMGATAFIMAMFLNIPYMHVAIAAVIPSILYFTGLLMQVDAYAAKKGISGLPRTEIPTVRQTMKEGWFYIFAFLLLIWFVAHLRLEAQAPFYATAALLALTMLRKETRLNIQGLIRFIESIGKLLAELSAVLAGVSLMIGALTMTGVSSAFASEIIGIAGGNLFLLLLLGAGTSLILGTGMTITACYIFLALMIAPVLVGLGLNLLAVHLFVLYYGMLSYITPPVAIGAFAAATVAEAPAMKTGFYAMRLGMITYFIPFFFVMNPALVLQGGSPAEIFYMVITALLGVILISGSLEGYMWGVGKIGWIARLATFVSGFLIAIPEIKTDIYGVVVAGIAMGIYLFRRKWGEIRVTH
ncbi:MAG: TRAP transporter fused permease subunit [Deltaproteobacteria bacterium]|nr:TRAP transporter fused permease subunit [Deltaproteobacteria bacterium]